MLISRPALQGWALQFASTVVLVCVHTALGDLVWSAEASEVSLRSDAETLFADAASRSARANCSAMCPRRAVFGFQSPNFRETERRHSFTKRSTSLYVLAQADPVTELRPSAPAASAVADAAVEPTSGSDSAAQMAERMRQAAQRQRLNESLIRDREYEVLLTDARRAFSEGRSADGLQALQAVFDAAHDVFLWQAGSQTPLSAKERARRLLSSLPETDRLLYETMHGTDARLMWDDYLSSRSRQLLEELTRRYLHTRAGEDALRMCALSAMDQGDMASAFRWWRLLLEDPIHTANLDCSDRLWIDVAAVSSGQRPEQSALSRADLQTPLTIGQNTRTAGNWLAAMTEHVSRRSAVDPHAEWTTPFGSDSGIRIDSGSVPSDRPLWTARFGGEPSASESGITQVAFHDDSAMDEVINRVADAWETSRSKDYDLNQYFYTEIPVDPNSGIEEARLQVFYRGKNRQTVSNDDDKFTVAVFLNMSALGDVVSVISAYENAVAVQFTVENELAAGLLESQAETLRTALVEAGHSGATVAIRQSQPDAAGALPQAADDNENELWEEFLDTRPQDGRSDYRLDLEA